MEKSSNIRFARDFGFLLVFTFFLIGFSSSASYSGSFDIGSRGGNIIISPDNPSTSCSEDWSASFWSGCLQGYQTFVCTDRNDCGTTNLRPVNCGQKVECSGEDVNDESPDSSSSTTSGSSGGGGGDSSSEIRTTASSCTENWECSDWSGCSFRGVQTRKCTDLNSCGTTQLEPLDSKECEESLTNLGADGGFFSFITGAVIGGGKAWGLALVLVLLLGVLLWIVAGKKKEAVKKVKKK